MLPFLLMIAIIIGVILLGDAVLRPDGDGIPRAMRSYARTHGFDVSEYPESIVALYRRNPDARQFALDYPLKHSDTLEIDLSGELGGGVPQLYQWDERWGYRSYNQSIMGLSGCGPTCLSMVAIYLRGDASMDPYWMAQYAEQGGYNVVGSGTAWSFMTDGARALGIDVTEIPMDEQRIMDNLAVGNPIVCVVGPGDFTTDGHFIVLVGAENGKIRVNDPNSMTNSGKLWTFDRLLGQVQALWVMR